MSLERFQPQIAKKIKKRLTPSPKLDILIKKERTKFKEMPSYIANEINLCRCRSIARMKGGDSKYKIFAKEKSREICSPQKSRNIKKLIIYIVLKIMNWALAKIYSFAVRLSTLSYEKQFKLSNIVQVTS